jgi:hypothetical protein
MVTLCFFVSNSLIYCNSHDCVAYITSLVFLSLQTEHLRIADLTFKLIPFL